MPIDKLLYELRKSNLLNNYGKKGRYIPSKIYQELKSKKYCGKCGKKRKDRERFQIHHIKEVSKGGKNTRDNLIAICKSCHNKIHKKVIPTSYQPSSVD